MQPNIVIIDYGVGNNGSIANAIYSLGLRRLKVSVSPTDIANADALILPGVGAFETCAKKLKHKHLDDLLNEMVFIRKKPILGICVGMQLMATKSEENGLHAGLDWIPGRVVKLKPSIGLSVPHVGWNDVKTLKETALSSRISGSPSFYFDHSYHYQCDPAFVTAECDYGIRVTAAINKENIYGVQFHPEKSQNNGLRLFRGFFNAVHSC